ncbi:hypothetical protein J4218_01680 [Candidatus Pacearchaeota archaeon]|nr:hypothetical protein [uncultured archaeon]MBS3078808.1 hypothetical protein [Candidatus Pacearchaeota archaeon]
MVHLVGVHHAGFNSLFGIPELTVNQFGLIPGDDFLTFLSDFPDGTKVGLETFTTGDFETVQDHLASLRLDGRYPSEHNKYWDALKSVCGKFRFPYECLEDTRLWYKYNQLMVNFTRLNEVIHERVLFQEEGESDFHYNVKLAKCNELRHRSQLKVKQVHELDRDKRLLERIAEAKVDIAIVGDGHAAVWYAEKDRVKREFGIDLESYSTELMTPTGYPGQYVMEFTQNATPNDQTVFYNNILLRSLRLVSGERLIYGRKPDFVGTWRNVMPSEGYFEVFSNGNGFSGEISDCIGDAVFEGEVNDQGVRFIKKYTRANQTLTKPIEYRGMKVDGGYCGYYGVKGCGGGLFFMRAGESAKPLDLSVGIYRTLADKKEELHEIADQLFGKSSQVAEVETRDSGEFPF